MRFRLAAALGLALVLPCSLFPQSTGNPVVRFATSQGNIDVTLTPGAAPKTVANFLNYVKSGAYSNSVIHRSVANFVIQGGGYRFANSTLNEIPASAAVANEYNVPNTRGTIAMAKLGSDPNSATNQWFFNTVDNSQTLNQSNNGGFTVFGRIADAASLAVMDKIAAVPTGTLTGFADIPLINFDPNTSTSPLTAANLVIVTAVTQLDAAPAPVISANGISGASGFGGYAYAAPGSYLEIYGSNLAGSTREWATTDFNNRAAPTALDGVSVTINGQAAYVNYISPTQINVQVPQNVPGSGSVPVVITYQGSPSASASLTVKSTAPGLLAPASFNVNGKQYVVAIRPGGAFVGNGSVPNVPDAAAKPGETLTFYGLGFGPVNPFGTQFAGRIIQGSTSLAAPVQFTIGGVPAQVQFAGLAPGLVGVYQFNVTVPPGVGAGDQLVVVKLDADTIPQTLYLPIGK